jgi:hypothetical protein
MSRPEIEIADLNAWGAVVEHEAAPRTRRAVAERIEKSRNKKSLRGPVRDGLFTVRTRRESVDQLKNWADKQGYSYAEAFEMAVSALAGRQS